MNISISNIAWDREFDDEVSKILRNKKIKRIEIAPTKISKEPTKESEEEIKKYKNFWNDQGINIIALQSVLYGHPELTIFDDEKTRNATFSYLSSIIKISSTLGAKVIVFGSPKNRNVSLVKMSEAWNTGKDFFYKLGEKAKEYEVKFCIEPNPKEYGTNFINNTNEAINFIEKVNHPNFRLHMDLSTLTLNGEDISESIRKGSHLLSHFHISEPYLKPVNKNNIEVYKKAIKTLKEINYKGSVSIEMLTDKGKELKQIDEALLAVLESYE